MSDAPTLTSIAATLARIEQRQAAYETVAHNIFGTLEAHTALLEQVLEAATVEPGPSPLAETMAAILASLQEQERLLTELPSALAVTIRDELQRELEGEGYETEPAETREELAARQ